MSANAIEVKTDHQLSFNNEAVPNLTDTEKYSFTVEGLFQVFASDELDYGGKLKQLLQIGLNYFNLDTALLSTITGRVYQIECITGINPQSLQPGDQLELDDTMCSTFVENNSCLLIDDLTNSELNELPCHQITRMESFVGVTVNTHTGPFGTVSFSSTKKQGKPYCKQDESMALLIGSWIGFIVGNQEQFDFTNDQSEYYKDLYYSIPAMMFLSDADGLIISASNMLSEELGLVAEDVSGNNCHSLFSVNDKAALKAAIENGNVELVPLIFDLPSGEQLEIELNCRIKKTGVLRGVRSVVLTDVSERNAALRRTIKQNQQLESANEHLNQFAFIASHDLQEPLRKIQQFSSFLQEDLAEKLTGDASYHLSVVVDASERMSTLIHDLLRYSGASQEEPKIESVSLNKLFDLVQQDLEISIAETNASISVDTLPVVQGDSALLRQMFVNLIGNGIKYRSPDREPKITVSSYEDGITITDNGIGFSKEFEKKIFAPFTRLHSNKEFKGNGIGLAICSTVCAKHQWTISATGTPDQGATFTINFNDHS